MTPGRSDAKKRFFAGLDIGGTTVKSVLVDNNGAQVGDVIEVRSKVTEGYETTFGQLEEALQQLAKSAQINREAIVGAGLDVPAPCSNGVVWSKANMAPDWVGAKIRDLFSKRAGIPIYMTNDCNAAGFGEYVARPEHFGGLLYVAPGTGLGGGLVLPGGKIYEGVNGLALEVGHVTLPFYEEDGELPACSCGLKGCMEAWVSLVALRRRLRFELAKERWANHPLKLQDGSIEEKAFKLRDFAEQGDELALEIFKNQGFMLGYGIADLVRVFDPGLVVVGGGLAEASFRDKYMDWILEGFSERAWPMYRKSPIDPEKTTTHFEWARAGDAAGAVGMAYVAYEMFGKGEARPA